MGPRPDGRGKPLPRLHIREPQGVNGAAARRPRKDLERRHMTEYQRASMGPRPDGRGKAAEPRTPLDT